MKKFFKTNLITNKNSTFMQKIKYLIILAVMIISANSFGQNNCNNAVELTNFNSIQDFYMDNDEYWLTFTADSEHLEIILLPTMQSNATNISSINLYEGSCGRLTLVDSIILLNNDSLIRSATIHISKNYFIQMIRNGDDGYFSLNTSNYNRSSPQLSCGPTTCILNPNTDFSDLSAFILNYFASGTTITDPLSEATNNWWTECCNWIKWEESPQIKRELISGSNYNYYLHMWARYDDMDPNDGIVNPVESYESAYNRINGQSVPGGVTLTQGNNYRLKLKYRPVGINSLDIYLMDQSQINNNFSLPPTSSQGQLISTINFTNSSMNWQNDELYFNCNSSAFNAILFVPHRNTENTVNNVFTYTYIDIDDVVLENAPINLPISLNWNKPCVLNANFSFNMPSTPNITYSWILPGNAAITNSNPINNISVNWNNAGNAEIKVVGINNLTGCIVYEGKLMVELDPCPPSPAYYQINNLTATQIKQITGLMTTPTVASTNLSISINGTIVINENLFFTSCTNVFLGPNAKIIVMPGCTLAIANSNFTGCDCKWDGIYVEDPSATLIIQNSNISKAKNAVVSSNKGKIHLYNSIFSNNALSVWIRRYNPELSIDINGNPIIPLPHNAYIAKCLFDAGTPNTDWSTGIKIDTVYNVTIGDVNDAINKNEYYKLYRSIEINSSDVYIYNNYFNQCLYSYNSNMPYYHNAEPTTTSIFIKRPYDINPPQINNFAIKNIVNIGGTATNQPNTFYLQEIGVYGFNTQVNILNNTFTNQRFTAIHLKDLYNSNISGNSISMQSNLSATNNLYNSTILAEHSVASYTVKLNINSNTINNTRTGINTRNCNGASNGSSYCNVAFNTINFEGLGTSTIPFIGINSSSCAYTNIEQNTIKYIPTTTPNYAVDYDRLKGISVASVQNSKVSKNSLIRLGMGIWGADNLLGTQFFCNNLDNNYYGFYFKPNYAIISDQGSISSQSANYWYDNNAFVTPAMRRMGGGIVLQYGNVVNWYHSGGLNLISNIQSPYIPTSHSLNQYINPVANVNFAAKCNIISESTIYTGEGREAELGSFVGDTLAFQSFPIENEYYAKDFTYRKLDEIPDLLDLNTPDDTVYQNFYYTIKQQGIGKFADVAKYINTNHYNDAAMLNNAINPANSIEGQKKIVNAIFLQKIVNNIPISKLDSISLMNIAMQLPFIGGDAVYSARVILGLDPADLSLDYVKSPQSQTFSRDEIENVRLYPNPASDVVSLIFSNETKGNTVFELYDINSKKILLQNIPPKTTEFTINLNNIMSGIYYCKISNNEVLLKNKLIIHKK